MTAALARPEAAVRLRELPRTLDAHEGFAAALAALQSGQAATFDGVWGSSCALLAARLVEERSGGPLVVVLPTSAEMDAFCDDLALFSAAKVALFPPLDGAPEETSLDDDAYGERLRTLKRIAADEPPRLIATCIQALLQPVPPVERLATSSRLLRVGERLDVESLLAWLVERGFESTTAVQLPGEFTFRGGILDLFAPDWEQPVRLELFDDEVESIRRFDVATQRSLEKLDAVELTAVGSASEFKSHLADYLPANAWFALVEPHRLHEEGEQFRRHADQPERLHGTRDIFRHAQRFAHASISALAVADSGVKCQLRIESVERFSGDIGQVREELDEFAQSSDVIVIAKT
jgi:transcription-repair coupling factor (superfamily II helicase)